MPHVFSSSKQTEYFHLSSSKLKSRSHLALFETVERPKYATNQRQSEHHNAFGYLGQSLVSSSSSCHQLVRGSPESLFWRLPDKVCHSVAKNDRNESSAIFAVMGVDNPHHYPTNNWSGGRLCLDGYESSSSSAYVSTPNIQGTHHQANYELNTSSPSSNHLLASTPVSSYYRVPTNSPLPIMAACELSNVSPVLHQQVFHCHHYLHYYHQIDLTFFHSNLRYTLQMILTAN